MILQQLPFSPQAVQVPKHEARRPQGTKTPKVTPTTLPCHTLPYLPLPYPYPTLTLLPRPPL